jgi:uncharacterized protein (DUF433 family)
MTIPPPKGPAAGRCAAHTEEAVMPNRLTQGKPIMLDWSKCPVLESIPGKVSGAWVFRGTRVPVSAILKNLKHLTLDQLVEDYPSVPRERLAGI